MTKIIGLQARNFKRLKAVHITPKDNTIVIGGRNAQGKTSVLDAIWAALGGGRAMPEEPIHRGKSRSEIELDLGELVVIRKFTSKGSQLEVRNKVGTRVKSPQGVLDAMVGALAFDPLEFTRKKPPEQAETLRQLGGLDTSEVDGEIERLTEERKQANREVKRIEGAKASAKRYPNAPDQLVVLADVVQELEKAQQHNARRGELLRRAADLRTREAECDDEIGELRRRIAALEDEIVQLGGERDACRTQAEDADERAASMEPRDVEAIRTKMRDAEALNEQVRANMSAAQIDRHLVEAKDEAEAKDDALKDARERRQEMIAAARFPIDGLGIDEDGVTFQGLPLEQASGAEKIRVSTAIGLAMNPELRVLLVRDGSLLDGDSLEAMAKLAKDADAQVWIERVGKGDEVTVVIEDGEVVEAEDGVVPG